MARLTLFFTGALVGVLAKICRPAAPLETEAPSGKAAPVADFNHQQLAVQAPSGLLDVQEIQPPMQWDFGVFVGGEDISCIAGIVESPKGTESDEGHDVAPTNRPA